MYICLVIQFKTPFIYIFLSLVSSTDTQTVGALLLQKNLKMNFFGQKSDTIWAKVNHINFFVHNVFFWTIICMNIIDYQFCLTS